MSEPAIEASYAFTYPTMMGTSAKSPFMMEIEGYSVKSLLSNTGWKEP